MKNIEIAPFYLGQEVVANCSHPLGAFKKGDEFVVKQLTQCKCGAWKVDISLESPYKGMYCFECNYTYYRGDVYWFNSKRFSPKLEIKDFISMKELAEKQLELISAN